MEQVLHFFHAVCTRIQNFCVWFFGFSPLFLSVQNHRVVGVGRDFGILRSNPPAEAGYCFDSLGQFASRLCKVTGRQGYGCRGCVGWCISCVVSTCLWLMLRSERKTKWEVPLSSSSVNGALEALSTFQRTEAKPWELIASQKTWCVLDALFEE